MWFQGLYFGSATSIESYRHVRQLGVSIDTFTSENGQISQDIFNRMVGMESKLDKLAEDVTRSQATAVTTSEHNEVESHLALGATSIATSVDHTSAVRGSSEHGQVLPTVKLQMLRRVPCQSACNCACHQTQRFTSPRFLESVFGNLFLGYSGLPSVFRKCTILGCRQDSSKLAKMTYRFPCWFWQRAVNIAFSYTYSAGPEWVLRLTCIRPWDSDWFQFARTGNVKGLKRFIVDKQASGTLHIMVS